MGTGGAARCVRVCAWPGAEGDRTKKEGRTRAAGAMRAVNERKEGRKAENGKVHKTDRPARSRLSPCTTPPHLHHITVQVGHSGEVIVAPMPGFDIDRTAFKALPATIGLFGVVPIPSCFCKTLEVVQTTHNPHEQFLSSLHASPSLSHPPIRHLISAPPPSAPHTHAHADEFGPTRLCRALKRR